MNFDVNDLVRSNFLPTQVAEHHPESNRSSARTNSLLNLVSYSLGEMFQYSMPVATSYPQSEPIGPLPLGRHLLALAENRPFVPDSLEWIEGREAYEGNEKMIYEPTESTSDTYVMEWQFPTSDREELSSRQNNFQLLHELSQVGAPISPLIRSEIYLDGSNYIARAEFVDLGEGVDFRKLSDPFDRLAIGRAVLSALKQLHDFGVYHGDASYSNWIVRPKQGEAHGFEVKAIDLDYLNNITSERRGYDRMNDLALVTSSVVERCVNNSKHAVTSDDADFTKKLKVLCEMTDLIDSESERNHTTNRSQDVGFLTNMFIEKIDELLALRPPA